MKKEHLAILSAYLDNQETVIRRLLGEIGSTTPENPEKSVTRAISSITFIAPWKIFSRRLQKLLKTAWRTPAVTTGSCSSV